MISQCFPSGGTSPIAALPVITGTLLWKTTLATFWESISSGLPIPFMTDPPFSCCTEPHPYPLVFQEHRQVTDTMKKKKKEEAKRPFARTETVLGEPPGERNPTNIERTPCSLVCSSTASPRAWFPRGWVGQRQGCPPEQTPVTLPGSPLPNKHTPLWRIN